MKYVDTSIDNTVALTHQKNKMMSRLLLLRLQRLHYEQAPKTIKDRHLPVLYVDPAPPEKVAAEQAAIAAEMIAVPPERPLRTVLCVVSNFYNIQQMRILNNQRTQDLIRPRHVAMYLAMEFSPLSISAIARFFNRDHTVLLHARKSIKKLMVDDANLARQVRALRAQLVEMSDMPSLDQVADVRQRASKKFYAHMEAAE